MYSFKLITDTRKVFHVHADSYDAAIEQVEAQGHRVFVITCENADA